MSVLYQLIRCEKAAGLTIERCSAETLGSTVGRTQVWIISAGMRLEGDVAAALIRCVDRSIASRSAVEAWDVIGRVGKHIAVGAGNHNVEVSSILSFVRQSS